MDQYNLPDTIRTIFIHVNLRAGQYFRIVMQVLVRILVGLDIELVGMVFGVMTMQEVQLVMFPFAEPYPHLVRFLTCQHQRRKRVDDLVLIGMPVGGHLHNHPHLAEIFLVGFRQGGFFFFDVLGLEVEREGGAGRLVDQHVVVGVAEFHQLVHTL